MSTSVTAETQYYTWDNIPYTWDACNEIWDECGMTVFEATTTETTSIADENNKAISPKKAEQIVLLEKLLKTYSAPRKESFSVSDKGNTKSNILRKYVEKVSATDDYSKTFTFVRVEPIKLNEHILKQFFTPFKEIIGLKETYWDNILFFIDVCENVSLAEDVFKTQNQNIIERLLIGELLYNQLSAKIKETVAFKDELKRQALFERVVNEILNTSDKSFKSVNQNTKESCDIVDAIKNAVGIAKQERATLVDNFTRKFLAHLEENEKVGFVEFIRKEIDNNNKEALIFYDTIIQACEAVMSNIYAAHGEMSLARFLEIVNTPSGYTAFTDFKVGEYEYQDALVRILIRANVTQSQPSVSDVVMHLDIPDTDDRGTLQIVDVSAPTKVYYNKHYYHPPEVSVVVIGGNTINGVMRPNLISTDGKDNGGRYFLVEILNENNQRVAGTVSWVGKGY